MSLSERITIVNQKNAQRENELIKQLNSLALSIKNEIEDHTKKRVQNPESKQDIQKQRSKEQVKQQVGQHSKEQVKQYPKSELFYESSNELPISIFNIKSNCNYDFIIQSDNEINLSINVFELIRLKNINSPIKIETEKTNISLNPKTTIPNAELYNENDTIVIKFHYKYDKKYRNHKISLEDLGFDYVITLNDDYYKSLYSFENKSGKFRVDLQISLV